MSVLAPDSTFGIYHIIRPIGGGGMAKIYLAKTKGLAGFEKYLALKVINADLANERRFVQMLIDEAKITVGLSHVNIAQVFDLGQVAGIYYIAMEYVDGLDVLRLVNGLHRLGQQVPIDAAVYIARQVCAGLDYAHGRTDRQGKPLNLVHRDISPQNVLVSCNGEVKIVDFGIAKAAGLSTKTQAGVVKGKVNYMAPEQVTGKPADRRSDVFSVGIVTWEMLTSRMVYSNNDVATLIETVRRAQINPPSTVRADIPPELDDIVLKALAPRPEDRYQTAHEFQTALTKFLAKLAPDYGAARVAELIQLIREQEQNGPFDLTMRLSKDDRLRDHHSVIEKLPGDGKPRLVIESDRGKQTIELGESLTLGRAAQLSIADIRVSRRHARIFRDGDNFLVEDLNSANGTTLNKERITGPQRLKHRDEIRVGQTVLVFLAPQPGAPLAQPLKLATGEVIKLEINVGGEVLTKVIDEQQADVSYTVHIGALTLQGLAAQLASRADGVWLHPTGSRLPIFVNDQLTSSPTQLQVGDTLQIGTVTCRLAR